MKNDIKQLVRTVSCLSAAFAIQAIQVSASELPTKSLIFGTKSSSRTTQSLERSGSREPFIHNTSYVSTSSLSPSSSSSSSSSSFSSVLSSAFPFSSLTHPSSEIRSSVIFLSPSSSASPSSSVSALIRRQPLLELYLPSGDKCIDTRSIFDLALSPKPIPDKHIFKDWKLIFANFEKYNTLFPDERIVYSPTEKSYFDALFFTELRLQRDLDFSLCEPHLLLDQGSREIDQHYARSSLHLFEDVQRIKPYFGFSPDHYDFFKCYQLAYRDLKIQSQVQPLLLEEQSLYEKDNKAFEAYANRLNEKVSTALIADIDYTKQSIHEKAISLEDNLYTAFPFIKVLLHQLRGTLKFMRENCSAYNIYNSFMRKLENKQIGNYSLLDINEHTLTDYDYCYRIIVNLKACVTKEFEKLGIVRIQKAPNEEDSDSAAATDGETSSSVDDDDDSRQKKRKK